MSRASRRIAASFATGCRWHIVIGALLAFAAACQPTECDAKGSASCKGTPPAAVVPAAAPSLSVNGEQYYLDRSIGAAVAGFAGDLQAAGIAYTREGQAIQLFRGEVPGTIEPWERASKTATGEWAIWQPQSVSDLIHARGAIPVSVQSVVWQDSCLEVPLADEACLKTEQPGYRVNVQMSGRIVEFHIGIRNGETSQRIASIQEKPSQLPGP